jgi:four helix bundle protein
MTNDAEDKELLAWEGLQRENITGDPLWRLNCYREALFLVDLVREDAKLFELAALHPTAREQLLTSVGSIAANIAEGYGRPTTRDRTRFFSYALGSAREAITWYQALRPRGEHPGVVDRLDRLARVRRMLLGLLSRLKVKGARKFDSW